MLLCAGLHTSRRRVASAVVPHRRSRAVVRSPGILQLSARQCCEAGLREQTGRVSWQLEARRTGPTRSTLPAGGRWGRLACPGAPALPAAPTALFALLQGSRCSACGHATRRPSRWLAELAGRSGTHPKHGGPGDRPHTTGAGLPGCTTHAQCHVVRTAHGMPVLQRRPHLSASTMTPADARMLPRLQRARSSSCAVSISSVTVDGWCASRSASSVSLRSSNQADCLQQGRGGPAQRRQAGNVLEPLGLQRRLAPWGQPAACRAPAQQPSLRGP